MRCAIGDHRSSLFEHQAKLDRASLSLLNLQELSATILVAKKAPHLTYKLPSSMVIRWTYGHGGRVVETLPWHYWEVLSADSSLGMSSFDHKLHNPHPFTKCNLGIMSWCGVVFPQHYNL
jgi:hypothetical protein